MRKLLVFSFLLLFANTGWAAIVSLDSNYVAGQTDFVTKLNNDRTALTNAVNNIEGTTSGSPQSAGQIRADTIGEENMADDANPRIRTNQGAACADLVVTGLLPSTTSGTLVGSIPAGTAYPDGYYVNKASATGKTFTASKWTWVYINSSGTFEYNEESIGASTPSAPANTATLCKVSTDATEINTVTDLRTTSCTAGPFSVIVDEAAEASLDDILRNGSPIVKDYDNGWIQGCHIEYYDSTNFTVTPGSAYINGKYRSVSSDTVVPVTADNPSTGVSGIDTSSIVSDTEYNVFLAADQETVKTFSVSFSASAAPAGVTNYRKIGTIKTIPQGAIFTTSSDPVTIHSVNTRLAPKAFINFNGTNAIAIRDSFNVSGITDDAQGLYTITWGTDFADANYVISGLCGDGTNHRHISIMAMAAGSCQIQTGNTSAGDQDVDYVTIIAMGDQ